jgi:hypothetical protein
MATEGMRAEPLIPTQAPARPRNDPQIDAIEARLHGLEKLVKIHDKTIKRGIELAASYLNQENPNPAKPSNDAPQPKPHHATR